MKRWFTLGEWRPRYLPAIILVLLCVAPAAAWALSQGYHGSADLVPGSLVSLDPSGGNTVQAANIDRVDELLGVVVASENSLIATSSRDANVQVITTGTAQALVSTLDGDIHKGDAIAVSPINGVGMKALASGRVLGLAQADFNASSPSAVSKQVQGKTGRQTISVGVISVTLSVGYYTPKAANTAIPQSVQNVARLLAGKDVSPFRIVLAAILLLVGIILSIVILNSAVRSSLESVGRNPLARKAINSGLLKILLLTVAILLLSFASVYFIIKG